MKYLKFVQSLLMVLPCCFLFQASIIGQATPPAQCSQNWNPSPCNQCIIPIPDCNCTVWTYCGNSANNDECVIMGICRQTPTNSVFSVRLRDADGFVLLDEIPPNQYIPNQVFRMMALNPDGTNFNGNLRFESLHGSTSHGFNCVSDRIPFNCN